MKVSLVVVLLQITLAVFFSTFGQTEGTPRAEMVNSFDVATNGDLRSYLDEYFAALASRPRAKGLVYTYGPAAYVATRTRLINNRIRIRKFDPTRIEFKPGRNIGKVRTDLWIVPEGAAPPEIKPEAWIATEFGSVAIADGKRKIASFFADKKRACSEQVYIFNYGTPKQVAQREMWLRNTRVSCGFDAPPITLVNGGPGPVRTVMWLVPPGAANPTP